MSAEVNYGIRFTEDHELNTFLEQLCTEVHNRLTEISAKGKTITLKYMVRAQDAPVETAKFMGHGFCDHVTKSTTLSTSTCDLGTIRQTIFNIKNVLNVPPKELRGIGIQISKLDAIQNDPHKANPLKNLFAKAEAKQKQLIVDKKPLLPTTFEDNSAKKSSLRKIKSFSGTPSRDFNGNVKSKQSNQPFQKIFEELDLSVLAELPDDIREEVLQEQDRILKEKHPSNESSTTRKLLARKLENDFVRSDPVEKPKPPVVVSMMITISFEVKLIHLMISENFRNKCIKFKHLAARFNKLA